MHTLFGRIIKYVLRVILVFILSLLLIGLIKYNGNVNAYVASLNNKDWKQAWGQLSIFDPGSFSYMFWGDEWKPSTGGIDLLSGELLTGDLLTGEVFTGLNPYDGSREEALDTITGSNVADTGTAGFKAPEPEILATGNAEISRAQLYNLIKQREMKK